MNGKTATVLSILPIPDMVEQMLRADDIEMIKLGATWVEQNCPQRTWQEYMSLVQNRFMCYVHTVNKKPEIAVVEINFGNEFMWGPNIKTQLPNYKLYNKLYTGQGGYDLFQQSIQQFYNKTNQ